jgi:L-ornithine Nalpha-acyltransferase
MASDVDAAAMWNGRKRDAPNTRSQKTGNPHRITGNAELHTIRQDIAVAIAHAVGEIAVSDSGTNMHLDRLTGPKFLSPWGNQWQEGDATAGWFGHLRFVRGRDQVRQPLGSLGQLEVCLAHDRRTIKRLQALRYKIFYEHGRAIADLRTRLTGRDTDSFDELCDHLMVVDRSLAETTPGESPIVGTYRLLRQEIAERHGGFYSAAEFEIADLLKRHPGKRFLELGRSCVLPAYRSRRAIELLWHGISAYVREHRIDVMVGCASFEGADREHVARSLSFLHHFASTPEPWRAAACWSKRIKVDLIPRSAIDVRRAWRELPPLIKGYLRAGAFVGDDAVFDEQFRTIDVLVVLPVEAIDARYARHFGTGTTRNSAV